MSDIQALRAHLFSTLTALQDKDNPMDIERAKAICQVGDVIVDTAKAEIDFAKVIGNVDTQFFHKQSLPAAPALPLEAETKQTKTGVLHTEGNVTTHKMK